jgi:hypothetical protein
MLGRARVLCGLAGHAAVDVHLRGCSPRAGGVRPPIRHQCDRAFPERGGWFHGFYRESRQWSATSPLFRNWIDEREQRVVSVRVWQPSSLSGLLQTETFALALLRTFPGATNDEINERLSARLARQAILFRENPAPPLAWFLVDEGELHRRVGSAEIMAGQLEHLLMVSAPTPDDRSSRAPGPALGNAVEKGEPTTSIIRRSALLMPSLDMPSPRLRRARCGRDAGVARCSRGPLSEPSFFAPFPRFYETCSDSIEVLCSSRYESLAFQVRSAFRANGNLDIKLTHTFGVELRLIRLIQMSTLGNALR